jgi:hypothetical protein
LPVYRTTLTTRFFVFQRRATPALFPNRNRAPLKNKKGISSAATFFLVPLPPGLGFHHSTHVTPSSHFNDLSPAAPVLN